MRKLLVVVFALVAAACASNEAAKKLAAAPLTWCNPCVHPASGCLSPCAAPAPAVAAAPKPPPYVPPPTPAISAAFDPAPGTFDAGQRVTLSSPTPGAVIHYTVDGSTPTEASPTYTAPLVIAQTTTIKAIATAPGVPESSVSQGTYDIKLPVALPASMTVTETGQIKLNEKIFFDTSKATIKPASYHLLDDVASAMATHPKVQRVRIEGHTDSSGDAGFNMQLSKDRAKAVKDYLVKKGVAADRLESEGFGSTHPIGDNKTKAGREENRRVDFFIAK